MQVPIGKPRKEYTIWRSSVGRRSRRFRGASFGMVLGLIRGDGVVKTGSSWLRTDLRRRWLRVVMVDSAEV